MTYLFIISPIGVALVLWYLLYKKKKKVPYKSTNEVIVNVTHKHPLVYTSEYTLSNHYCIVLGSTYTNAMRREAVYKLAEKLMEEGVIETVTDTYPNPYYDKKVQLKLTVLK